MTQEQLIEELKKLGMLHESGVLTDEEFQEMKQKLLAQMNEGKQYSYKSQKQSNSEYKHKNTNHAKDESTLDSSRNQINDLDDKSKDNITPSKDQNLKPKTSKAPSKKAIIITSCIVIILCIVALVYNLVKEQGPVYKIGVRIGNFVSHLYNS